MERSILVLDSPELVSRYGFVDLTSPVSEQPRGLRGSHGAPSVDAAPVSPKEVDASETPPSAQGGKSPPRWSPVRVSQNKTQTNAQWNACRRALLGSFQSCMDGPPDILWNSGSASSQQALWAEVDVITDVIVVAMFCYSFVMLVPTESSVINGRSRCGWNNLVWICFHPTWPGCSQQWSHSPAARSSFCVELWVWFISAGALVRS